MTNHGDGRDSAGLPHATAAAFSHPLTRRAWMRSRFLHYGRHLGSYVLLAVGFALMQAVTGAWALTLGLAIATVLIVVPGHWWNCRHASANPRRARLILEHYPWQLCLMEAVPEPDGATRSGGATERNRPSFRLTDAAAPERIWTHSVPGPGREDSSVRALCHPRVLVAAAGSAGAVQAWFAGDLRFGGVLSPPGGGQPVLLRARTRRGLKGEAKAAPPEHDALAIRAGLLDFRDLPKRHPLRREWETQDAAAAMRGTHRVAPPGPAASPTATALRRSPVLRTVVRTVLGLGGVLFLLLGVGLLVGAALPDGEGAAMRLALAGSALMVLTPAPLCLAGARFAGSGRGWPPRWPAPVSAAFLAAGLLLLWLSGLQD
ncbi:hypothetical protein [Streptomyces flaveus]|uniref:hypothetical protein n=1 Tax=Streptomyces flaveus TaxID=66370 RepID=UPI00331D7754